MKLRNVTFISLFLLALAVMAAEYGVGHYIVKKGFDDLEKEQVAVDSRRAKNEFLKKIKDLDIFLWDWSSWDDTFVFAQDGNEEYLKSNLRIDTFTEQSLNIIAIFGTADRMVYGRAIDVEENDDDALLHDFFASIKNIELPAIAEGGGHGGIILLPQGPLLFAKRPILKSSSKGAPAGAIIMARLLTDDIIEDVATRLELKLSVSSVNSSLMPDAYPAILDSLALGAKTVVAVKDENTINGYALLSDIKGQPALMLEVSQPRQISQQGRSVALYNTVFLALVIISFSAFVFFLLQKRIISRMERLNTQVKDVDMSGKTATHVTIDGKDEISELSQSVNAMLFRIAQDQKSLQKNHDELEDKIAERTLELEEANQDLMGLDKAKSHFLSSTSHELRTPLTAIHGFVKLMERTFRKNFQPHLAAIDNISPKIETYLNNFNIVHLETERLGRLIDDLLDLNKIEAGRVEWRDSDVDIPRLVMGAVTTISGQLESTPNVEMIVDIPDETPMLHVDKDRIHQVLINLLNNAAKFTEHGFIKVLVTVTNTMSVEFSVEDSGHGILEADRDQIFEIFYQSKAQEDYEGKPFGTGLGLAICKEIVEHYNGTIWVESTIEEGSAFKFTLPIS
ncbi:MAG: ATP-binding protein [Pseudodesulfovibrio sp.]